MHFYILHFYIQHLYHLYINNTINLLFINRAQINKTKTFTDIHNLTLIFQFSKKAQIQSTI
jgi:hypothetical protein